MRRLISAAALGIAAFAAHAQENYPARAIQIIVPNPPGGMNQITAQPMSAVIERIYKQPAPVVNKPGATAAVGSTRVQPRSGSQTSDQAWACDWRTMR